MIKVKFYAKAEKCAILVWERPEIVEAYLNSVLGKRIEVQLAPPTMAKTLQQLRYIHGVVFRLASETSGYTVQEVKGLLKGEFLTQYVKSPTGKEIAWVPSLADLKKDEMCEFIDNCVILCAKHWSCVIPSPDEVGY